MKFLKSANSLVKKGDLFIKKHGLSKFHQEAAELLSSANLQDLYHYQELIEASFEPKFNKIAQNFGSSDFSDLPITIARGTNCLIDLYFWRRRPTVIHNHHFSGAFQCLEGTNVDLEFDFKKKRNIGAYHSIGEIKIYKSHVIKRGDVQCIAPLNKFIHQNHHQAELTVNLCFRTPDLSSGNLSNYLFSGLRFEKNSILLQRVERLVKMIQLESFNFKEINLTIDDAIYFLIRTDGTSSHNKRLLEFREFLKLRVNKEVELDVSELLEFHDQELEKIMDQYN